MTRRPQASEERAERFSLRRWAQRKLDAARTADAAPVAPLQVSATASAAPVSPATPAIQPATPQPAAQPELPPIESLTIDSDFTLFMQPNVDAMIRRAALKQLFRDPRFNVMDRLDVYIDDYTQPDPIPESLVKQLAHARAIFDPPSTMLAPEGHVVDAPIASDVVAQSAAVPTAEACAPDAKTATVPAPTDPREGPAGSS